MLIYLLVISALVCYLLYPGESRYLEKAFASLRTLRIRADGKEEPDLSGLTYEEATNLLLGSLENTARELLGPAPNASPSQGAEPDLADELPVAEGQDVSAEQSQAVAMSEPTTEITVLDTEAEDAALDIMETEVSSEKPLAELEQDGAFDEPLSQVAEERGDSTEDITAEGIGETLTEESAAAAAEADSAEENDVWVADEIDNNISEAVLVEATDILSEETWALRPDSAEGTTGEALEPVQVGEPYEAAAEIHEISCISAAAS